MRVRKLAEVAPALLVSGYLLARVLGVAQAPQTGTGGAIDHGTLTGLGDDDHTQYTLTAEAQAIADAGDAAHVAAGDPHPQYTTAAEVAAALAAAFAAADGLGLSDNGAGVLSVNVDGSTIEIVADTLQVKDGGITIAKLSFDPATQAELDAVAAALAAHLADATDAHDASAVSVADLAGNFTGTDVEAVLAELFALIGGPSASGDRVVIEYSQTGHGFAVGEAVRFDGADWVLAQADSSENAEVFGIVSDDIDANTFELTTHGKIEGLAGLTAGVAHFLSPTTPGALTATPPATAGQVSKPILLAVSTTEGVVVNMRGIVLPGAGGGADLDWQDVETGVGFLTDWANIGAPYADVAYAKDEAKGLLYFRGVAVPDTAPDNRFPFVLPVGYRPSAQRITAAYNNGSIGPVEIFANGVIDFFGGAQTAVSFDGVVISL